MFEGRTLLHYTITQRIGAGGMGEVWRAWDTKLERDVAIKVLPGDHSDDPVRRQRFLREARSASALIHPNIVTIHEINSDQGVDFIVMEYVRGTSLAAAIADGRPPLRQALAYAAQIGDALVAAHSAGVVHRDLKPANIMIADSGLIKVLDFGLAKRMSASNDDTTQGGGLTVEGAIVGTPNYMSPEQALGNAVDARSDLFSFGVVLYQMLSGKRPFSGETNVTVLRQIVFETARPLAQLSADIPQELSGLVDKCLAKEASERYPDAATLVRDLRRIAASLEKDATNAGTEPTITGVPPVRPRRSFAIPAIVVASLLVAFGVTFMLRRPVSNRTPAASPPTTEATVDSLIGNPAELTQRARELLRRYDKTGYIDRAIRLSEAALKQDPKFAPAFAALAQAYLRKGIGSADKHWSNLAGESARQAVDANPELGTAHEVLGASLLESGDTAAAKKEVELALMLDPLNSGAYVSLAKLTAKSDPARADEFYRKAIDLAPEEWIPLGEYGIFHARSGRYKEAVSAWEAATRLAPDNVRLLNNLAGAHHLLDDDEKAASTVQAALNIDPTAATWNNLGTFRYFQGRYVDSVTAFENATQRDSANYQFWGNLGDAYRWAPGRRDKAAGAYKEAIRLLRERITRSPDDVEAQGRLTLYLAKSGMDAAALEELNRLNNAKPAAAATSFKKAVVLEVLRRREPALIALGEAIRAGYSLHEIESDPELASLRSDFRYHELLSSRPKK